jgi:hypothetical protein
MVMVTIRNLLRALASIPLLDGGGYAPAIIPLCVYTKNENRNIYICYAAIL